MSKKELIKELFVLMSLKNYAGATLGVRAETSEDKVVRSKDVRAFLDDLLIDNDDDTETKSLFALLDEAIRENIK